jgi:hypothetical protein
MNCSASHARVKTMIPGRLAEQQLFFPKPVIFEMSLSGFHELFLYCRTDFTSIVELGYLKR